MRSIYGIFYIILTKKIEEKPQFCPYELNLNKIIVYVFAHAWKQVCNYKRTTLEYEREGLVLLLEIDPFTALVNSL